MAEEVTAESLKQMLIDILRPTGNSSGQDPEGKTKGALEGVPAFVGSFADLGKSFEKLSTRLEEMAKAVGNYTDAVKQIPAAILGYRSSEAPSKAFQDAANLFGTGVGNFVRHIDQLRLEAQRNSNVGIGDGDPVRQRARFQAAGYEDNAAGLKGVTDAAGNFKSSLAGAGYGANDASQKFLDFAGVLRQEKAVANLINKNIISAADVPKLAQIAAQGQTSSLDTPESRKKLAEAMAREAEMINRMSSAYGISRDRLIDNAIAMNDNTESQIRQGALGDDAARSALRTAKTISMAGGATMIDLVEKLTTGSRLSKADRATLSVGTMGMGGQLTAAAKDVQATKNLEMTDPRRIAAEEKLAGVQAEIRARLISPEAQRLANSMKEGPMRDALVTSISEARLVGTAEKKIRDEQKVGYAESAKIAQQNIGGAGARGELTQTSGANKPKDADGAKVFQTVSELTEAYSKNAAAATVALAGLNEQLGKNAEVIDQIKKALTLPVGPASESVKDKAENIQKPIDEIVKFLNPNGPSKEVRGPGMTPSGDLIVTTPSVNITSPNVTVTGVTPAQPAGQPPVATPAATPAAPPAAPPASRLNPDGTIRPVTETRGTGTLGETGFPAEMKDVVAKLHKGETVLTPEQMKNLISGTGMMSASDTASAMLASMTGNKGDNQTGGIDITKIFDSVSTNISSASKPELITSDIIYTGTLKALKEINGVASPEPVKSDSKTPIAVSSIPPVNVVVPDIPTVKVADVKAPVIPTVKVAIPEVKAPDIPTVKVAIPEVKAPDIPTVKVADVKAPVIPTVKVAIPEVKAPDIPTVKVADVKAPVIPPVVVATPKPLTPAVSTNKTDSIIDKQLAKFGIDIGNLSGKLPSNIPTSVTTTSASISEIQKYMSQGMSQTDAQKKATKTTFETVPTFIPDSGIKKIFDSVSTTISSVTGGGSTTTKRVQSDDSKSAEKELSAAKEQFQIEKQALREKIKEQLGPNASRGDMTKAAMSSDEGINIFKQYNEKFNTLSKQIDAGISYQTNFESGIQRGNIVERSTTSVPITDAVKDFEPTPTENQKEERAEEPQTIDLSDSEPKTKDLYDQLIQLNSSIRQLVEHSASGVDLAGAQIKATRGLSGNRFA
jgi:hypothetical protein